MEEIGGVGPEQELFNYLAGELGAIALESNLQEIVAIVHRMDAARQAEGGEVSCFNCESRCVTGQCFACADYSHFRKRQESAREPDIIRYTKDFLPHKKKAGGGE